MRYRTPFREAMLTFRRTPVLSGLSVASIGFSLFTIGLFALVALNFRKALDVLAERVEVVAFVMRGTPTEAISQATQDITAFPEVLELVYVTPEQALSRARRELVEFKEAYRDLEVNPLPASFEIRLKPDFRDAIHAQAVAERMRGFPFIEDVRYGQDWVERLDKIRTMAAAVGLVIGLAFAAVAIVIIGVTIRITVLQRAREISIMRLVGATNNYIRGPFLIEGAVKGVLGGLLAILMSWLTFEAFQRSTGDAGATLSFFGPLQILVMVVFGTVIGLGGSLLSVGRQLRNV
ncbi:MAG: permease-like cell division protein FtsX [Gemmatimonadales bacterium]|nr:ABC transporter permease [Gemmatimonadota bacterium]MDX2057663.1 permease-like cell division protein FtsX [Gemmatimonadales bacterium]